MLDAFQYTNQYSKIQAPLNGISPYNYQSGENAAETFKDVGESVIYENFVLIIGMQGKQSNKFLLMI